MGRDGIGSDKMGLNWLGCRAHRMCFFWGTHKVSAGYAHTFGIGFCVYLSWYSRGHSSLIIVLQNTLVPVVVSFFRVIMIMLILHFPCFWVGCLQLLRHDGMLFSSVCQL